MPAFAFEALTAGGSHAAGVIDAETARHARQLLRTRGLYPTRVDGERAGSSRARRAAGTDATALAGATRQLAILLAAGMPVTEALDTLIEIDAGAGWDAIWTSVNAAVRRGASLAEALTAAAPGFPPAYIELVRAGETGGTLPAVLERLAADLERRAATRAQLRAALTYPAVMLVATTAILAFLLAWVVPQLTQLLRETHADLPLPTKALLFAVAVVRHAGLPLLFALVAAGIAVRAWIARPAGRRAYHALLLRLPVLGASLRTAAVARVVRTLSELVAGAVPIDAALGHAAATAGNLAIADAVARARRELERGRPLATALQATAVFPALVVRLAATGERGGQLAETLARAADALDAEISRRVATATALVEPALILAMGGVVLALVFAILLPLLTLSGGSVG